MATSSSTSPSQPCYSSDSMSTAITTNSANGVHLTATSKSTIDKSPSLVRPLRPVNHEMFHPFRHPEPLVFPPIYLRIPLFLLGLLLFLPRLLMGTFLVFMSFVSTAVFPPHFGRTCLTYIASSILFSVGFYSVKTIRDPDPNPGPEDNNFTVISNHVSMIDPLLNMSENRTGFVAKSGIRDVPLVGPTTAALGSLFVDRVGGNGRVTQQLSRRQRDTSAPRLCVYPEGTTTNGRYILRFRTGAFVAGMPVLPVVIRYPYTRFSPTYDTIRWWKFLVGLLMEPLNRVEYIHMPVYYPSEEEKKNPRLYADNVRKKMAERINVELSDASFNDKLEYHHIFRGDPLPKHLKLE